MKAKSILIAFFSMVTLAAYAQTNPVGPLETSTHTTAFKVEVDNLDEARQFEWDMVKNLFRGNDAQQEITLAFAIKNVGVPEGLGNFEVSLKGKTSELDEMTAKIKELLDGLDKL